MQHEEDSTIATLCGFDVGVASSAPSVSLLICHRHGVQGVELRPGEPLVVGRAQPAELVVRDPTLSRKHARFELSDGDVWVEDLHSTNGTRLNGKKIERVQLRVNDEVTLGSVVVSLHMVTAVDGQLQGLDSHDRFQRALEDEVVRAKTFGRPLSLVMVREARRDEGRLHRWFPRVRDMLRPVDRVGLYGPNAIEFLLPEASEAQARERASRIVGGRQPGEPALVCGVSVYPHSAVSAEELIELSRSMVVAASEQAPVRVAEPLIQRAPQPAQGTATDEEWLVRSPKMEEVRQTVARLARSAIPVLVIGETGTGKELIARALHYGGDRARKPLRCINCGAIPSTLIESALFGHERGAFTGADRRSKGVFEEANGGTVLLDEIGELAPSAQAALLRVLETKRLTRVGSSQEIAVDVRIVAATHRDLEKMCEQELFRLDLLYRLNTMVIGLPPLRERVEEISPLAEHFLHQASVANGCRVMGLSPEARHMLEHYAWPGNVRELRNVIERAVLVAQGAMVEPEDLSERVRQAVPDAAPSPVGRRRRTTVAARTDTSQELVALGPQEATVPRAATEDGTARVRSQFAAQVGFRERVQQLEWTLIRQALYQTGGNQTEAAARLGMPRRTLVYKLKELESLCGEWAGDEPTEIDGSLSETSPAADFKTRIQAFEGKLIRDALAQAGGSQREAARILDMPPRTLAYKVREYNLR